MLPDLYLLDLGLAYAGTDGLAYRRMGRPLPLGADCDAQFDQRDRPVVEGTGVAAPLTEQVPSRPELWVTLDEILVGLRWLLIHGHLLAANLPLKFTVERRRRNRALYSKKRGPLAQKPLAPRPRWAEDLRRYAVVGDDDSGRTKRGKLFQHSVLLCFYADDGVHVLQAPCDRRSDTLRFASLDVLSDARTLIGAETCRSFHLPLLLQGGCAT